MPRFLDVLSHEPNPCDVGDGRREENTVKPPAIGNGLNTSCDGVHP